MKFEAGMLCLVVAGPQENLGKTVTLIARAADGDTCIVPGYGGLGVLHVAPGWSVWVVDEPMAWTAHAVPGVGDTLHSMWALERWLMPLKPDQAFDEELRDEIGRDERREKENLDEQLQAVSDYAFQVGLRSLEPARGPGPAPWLLRAPGAWNAALCARGGSEAPGADR